MKKRNVLGYLLMIIALIIPIYMLSSMTLNKFMPKEDYSKYINNSKVNVQQFKTIKSEINKYNEKLTSDNSNIVDPFGSEDYKAAYDFEGADENFILGYIRVPRLDINYPLKLGTSDENIRNGFGHVDGTSLPDSGKGSRSVIAAHRVTRTDLMLYYVNKIQEGDVLFLDLGYKVIEYRYKETKIIDPSDWEKLLPEENQELITILTCDPPYPPFSNRMLVTFEKANELILEESEIVKNDTTEKSQVGSRDALTNLYKGNLLSKEEKKSEGQVLPLIILVITVLLWLTLFIVVIKFIRKLLNKNN